MGRTGLIIPVFLVDLNKPVILGRDPALGTPRPAEPSLELRKFTVVRTDKGSREVRLIFWANLSDPAENRLKRAIIDVPRLARDAPTLIP